MTRNARARTKWMRMNAMSHSTKELSGREQRLNEIIAGYLAALEAGKVPNRAELLAQHADLAVDLRAFFAANDEVQQIAEPMRPALATAGAATPNPLTGSEAPTLAPGETPPPDRPLAG